VEHERASRELDKEGGDDIENQNHFRSHPKQRKNTVILRHFAIFMATASVLGGCGDSGGAGASAPTTAELGTEAASTYAQIAFRAYGDSVQRAETLRDALVSFVAAPSETTQQAAKDAWLSAREPYLQTEAYRFYDGPIDNPADGPEVMINAWPLDEAHVDYTRDDAQAGIINDPSIVIDEATLRDENEKGGEENIAVGFHPIEFLLWGQDDPDPSNGLPGQRPATDYATDGSGTASNQDRRGEYLALLGDLLVRDLQEVVEAWNPDDARNFRADFEGGDWEAAVEKMLTGLIVLSGFEVAGQRLQVGLDNGDQEDEHSCFSDNTHRDMVQDVRGIQNVWLGRYAALDPADSVSGTGLREVVASIDSVLADQISAQIEQSLAAAEALRPTPEDPPFDVLISLGNTAGNAKVQDLIDSLVGLEALLSRAFTAFGFTPPQPQ
jgi:putative iron-regulated protein